MHVYEASDSEDQTAGLLVLYAPEGTQLPSLFVLSSSPMILGRESDVEIRLDANAVSRRHARMERRDTGWVIYDLDSRNGTIVDGSFIQEYILEPNVEIRIGDVILKFIPSGVLRYRGYRFDGTMESGTQRLATHDSTLLGGAQIDNLVASLERIAPTMLSVIVQGESGTGKEVVAREVHRFSGRRGAFVAVNCAAIPAALLESELFGYRRGAFTGADRDKVGLIKAAHQGTLFLDEIGDMPSEAQAKLLRVLQSREVMPVGATSAESVDVRIVCATHRDLSSRVASHEFRGDLYARLNEYSVTLPPLRERKEDIYLLARAFLARHGHPKLRFSFGFMVGLLHYDWPFNVRELEACLKRAVALSNNTTLEAIHLPDALREAMNSYGRRGTSPSFHPPSPADLTTTVQFQPPPVRSTAPSEQELRTLLQNYRGNVAAVGRALGKERMQIHRWMRRYSIEVDEYRQG